MSESSGRPSLRLNALSLGLFSLAYFGCSAIGESLSFQHSDYYPFWPPNGLFLGFLLLTDRRQWPALWGATLPPSLISDVVFHGTGNFDPLLTGLAVVFWFANTAEPLLAAWLLRRFVTGRLTLVNVSEFLALVAIGAILAPGLGATLGAAALSAVPGQPSFSEAWLRWWIGDALGILMVAPVVVTWSRAARSPRILRHPGRYSLELAVYCVVLTLIMERAFLRSPQENLLATRFPFFLVTPFMLWAGLRFEPRGASLCVLLLGMIVIWGTTRGFGAISQFGDGVVEQGLLLQALLAQASCLTLLFSSSIERREVAEKRLQVESLALARTEAEVRRQKDLLQSILDSMSEAVIVIDEEGKFVHFNPAARRLHQRGPESIPPEDWSRAYRIFLADGTTPCPVEQMPGMRALAGEHCDGVPLVIRPAGDSDPVYVRASARPIRAADGTITGAVIVRSDITPLVIAEREQVTLIDKLQQALSEIKTLRGLIPMCANCKKILNDAGAWERLESYLRAHTGAEFTHGLCPECGVNLCGDVWRQALQETPPSPDRQSDDQSTIHRRRTDSDPPVGAVHRA